MKWRSKKSEPFNNNYDIYVQVVDGDLDRGTVTAILKPDRWGRILSIVGRLYVDPGSSSTRELWGEITRGTRKLYPVDLRTQIITCFQGTWYAIPHPINSYPTNAKAVATLHISPYTYVYDDDLLTMHLFTGGAGVDQFSIDTVLYQRWSG